MQTINVLHEGWITLGARLGPSVDAATTHPQGLGLLRVGAVKHRFALSRPTLVSAAPKKALSHGSSPILACRTFRAPGDSLEASPPSHPSVAHSPRMAFHGGIGFGWTSNRCASSAIVCSPLRAARAPFDVKAGECFRRDRRLIIRSFHRWSHQANFLGAYPPGSLFRFLGLPLPFVIERGHAAT